jgi:hypothetical protein
MWTFRENVLDIKLNAFDLQSNISRSGSLAITEGSKSFGINLDNPFCQMLIRKEENI